MNNFKLYDEAYVEEHLTMEACIDLMKETLINEHDGRYVQFMRNGYPLPGGNILAFMPAYSYDGYFGAKVLAVFPKNYQDGYPSHQGQVLIFENQHGSLVALGDADAITRIRTAAVSAAATRALANANPQVLTIFGTGAQAITHLKAMLAVYKEFKEIRIWNRSQEKADKFAREHSDLAKLIGVSDARLAVKDADIICTVTASKTPLFKYEWLKKGVHINAVGSCNEAVSEIDEESVVNSRFFGDKKESVFKEAGDFLIPLRKGLISEDHFLGEIGQVFKGEIQGRESSKDITIFESLGIAVEDIASCVYLYENEEN